jgi:hypothetical protein
MPFAFIFDGTFFDMERFMHDVQHFVRVKGDRVDVRGRLLSIDGFSLSAGPNGFPSVKATISATAYLLSPDESTTPATSSTTSGSSTSGSSTSGSDGSSTPSSAGAAASEVAR